MPAPKIARWPHDGDCYTFPVTAEQVAVLDLGPVDAAAAGHELRVVFGYVPEVVQMFLEHRVAPGKSKKAWARCTEELIDAPAIVARLKRLHASGCVYTEEALDALDGILDGAEEFEGLADHED